MHLSNSEKIALAEHKQELIDTFEKIPKKNGCLELAMECHSSATALALFVSALYEVNEDKKIDIPVKVFVAECSLSIDELEKELSRVLSEEQKKLVGINSNKRKKFIFGIDIIFEKAKLRNLPYSISASVSTPGSIEPMSLEQEPKQEPSKEHSVFFAALSSLCSCFSRLKKDENETPFIGNPK
jgi:hypothetical protein